MRNKSELKVDTGLYDSKYEEGYMRGYEHAERDLGHYKNLRKERDAAWGYLRENDIHIVEYCWCGTRHFTQNDN